MRCTIYLFLLFFVVSGFCSLIYQVTWLRVAMAQFGVTAPSVAIVLSIFMAGLALGTWGAGRIVRRLHFATAKTFLRYYAATEACIAVSGVVVAPLFLVGHNLMHGFGDAEWGSLSFYLTMTILVALTLIPFCACMGATFPFAMAAIHAAYPERAKSSFSYLYVANVLGALAGCIGSAFVFIELIGFRNTMLIAACLNLAVAVCALLASIKGGSATGITAMDPVEKPSAHGGAAGSSLYLILFSTGFVSLAMELVWVRQFVPYLGPFVYTFAIILAVYLLATLLGSCAYRKWIQGHRMLRDNSRLKLLLAITAVTALFPLVTADYRFLPVGDKPLQGLTFLQLAFQDSTHALVRDLLRLIVGIGPFSALLGFLTPAVVDRISSGDPVKASRAYAINTLGCILGPLAAGVLLLPYFSERWSILLLSLMLFILAVLPHWKLTGVVDSEMARNNNKARFGILSLFFVSAIVLTKDFEDSFSPRMVHRDHTATVIAAGSGFSKRLFVNGNGVTLLTPITKMMVHLPLSLLPKPPQKGLVLCMGMGTSYRSMLSWGIPTTVVELVPSVPKLLPYFHADGNRILHAPNGKVVVDDARRFLERTSEKFDVIVVDPPPPLEAAVSSLLYSTEFYSTVADRLTADGILQQWIPEGEYFVVSSMVKALSTSFPYVRAFYVYTWGIHILASQKPIPVMTAAQMANALPERARADLMEWRGMAAPGPIIADATPLIMFERVLAGEESVQKISQAFPNASPLSDDRPVNEYYLLRRYFQWK